MDFLDLDRWPNGCTCLPLQLQHLDHVVMSCRYAWFCFPSNNVIARRSPQWRAVLLYVQKARLSPCCPSRSRSCCSKAKSTWHDCMHDTGVDSHAQNKQPGGAPYQLAIQGTSASTDHQQSVEVLETRHMDCCAGALLWIASPFVDILVPANCVLKLFPNIQFRGTKGHKYKFSCGKKYKNLPKQDHDRAGMTTTSKHPHMPIYHASYIISGGCSLRMPTYQTFTRT